MRNLQIAFIVSALFAVAASTSCSTSRGFGQDLQKVGNRIENRADSTGGAVPDNASAPTVTAY